MQTAPKMRMSGEAENQFLKSFMYKPPISIETAQYVQHLTGWVLSPPENNLLRIREIESKIQTLEQQKPEQSDTVQTLSGRVKNDGTALRVLEAFAATALLIAGIGLLAMSGAGFILIPLGILSLLIYLSLNLLSLTGITKSTKYKFLYPVAGTALQAAEKQREAKQLKTELKIAKEAQRQITHNLTTLNNSLENERLKINNFYISRMRIIKQNFNRITFPITSKINSLSKIAATDEKARSELETALKAIIELQSKLN